MAGWARLCGSGRGVHVAGDGLQHVLAGDPALQVLPVGGDDRQPVAAVQLELAQRLGEGLGGEQQLGVVLVGDGAWQWRPARAGRPG